VLCCSFSNSSFGLRFLNSSFSDPLFWLGDSDSSWTTSLCLSLSTSCFGFIFLNWSFSDPLFSLDDSVSSWTTSLCLSLSTSSFGFIFLNWSFGLFTDLPFTNAREMHKNVSSVSRIMAVKM